MKNISKLLLTLFTVLILFAAQAQPVEMADTMRSEGKIYVVVGIVLIVLTGLIVYLFMLDRRVKKLENGQK
jgi:hypothetical protein